MNTLIENDFFKFETSVDSSLKNIIKNLKPLTCEEEKKLFPLIRKGDIVARDRVLEGSLRYLYRVIFYYRDFGIPIPDLFQEGAIGILRATEKFDETRGIRFVSFARHYIKDAICKMFAEQSEPVVIPHEIKRLGRSVKKAQE